jgi:hypothetical protein
MLLIFLGDSVVTDTESRAGGYAVRRNLWDAARQGLLQFRKEKSFVKQPVTRHT